MLVSRDPPAELVRDCPDERPMPAVFIDDREMALWISDAIEAGRECRAKSRAQADWMKNPPR